MASLNRRVDASSSEEQSSREQLLHLSKLDGDPNSPDLLQRTQPRPAADGAAAVGGVPAVGPEVDAGGSTHWNRREKGGENAALARDARAQPGSSDGSTPSRSSRENEQPNLSTTGPGVGIAAASAAGANNASSEDGRDGGQRRFEVATRPEEISPPTLLRLLYDVNDGSPSKRHCPETPRKPTAAEKARLTADGCDKENSPYARGSRDLPSFSPLFGGEYDQYPPVELGTLNWTCERCGSPNFGVELACYGCKSPRENDDPGEPLPSEGSTCAPLPLPPLPPLKAVAHAENGEGGSVAAMLLDTSSAEGLVETLLAGPLGWVLLPMEQWPERFRQLYDARTTGNIVAPFVKRQPEYESLQRKVEKGRHLVTFDSFTHDWSHCYILVFLNFNSDSNAEAWLKRLLWLDKNGQIGESCLKAVIDLLVNILVKCHNARREYAEFAIKECTVFMDRTLETGKHDWCDGNLSSFRSRVAVTDEDTCALVRKCVRKFPREALPVILGEHSYKAIGLGDGQSDGPWLKGTGLQLSQSGKMSHPARLMQPWQSEREMNYNLLVWKALASILVGLPAAQLTAEEDRKLMPFATTAGGIAYAKKTAMGKGECCWSLLECKLCGATREGSLDSLSRGKSCSGSDGQGCRGHSDGKGGYKTAMHSEWIVLEIREVLNCCKSKPWALWWLSHFEQDRCFCYDCKPDHPANKKRKDREEREEEKVERAAKKQRKAEEKEAEKQRKEAEKRAKRAAEMPTGVKQTSSGKFEARISYAGKNRFLGTFDSKEEAVQGREVAREVLQKACVGGGTDEEKEAKAKRNVGLAKEAAKPARQEESAEKAEKKAKKAEKELTSLAEKQRKAKERASDCQSLDEYIDLLAHCTSASERLFVFETNSKDRLKQFIKDNSLDDLACISDKRFKRLKEIYQRQCAGDDEQTVALLLQKSEPKLPFGSVQPEELVGSWLSSRKGEWRESRKKRRKDKETGRAANSSMGDKEERAAKKQRKAELKEMPTGIRQKPSGKFEARMKYFGKNRYFGTFDSKEEAVHGRKVAWEVLQKACVGDGTDEEKEAKAKRNVDLAKEAAKPAPKRAKRAVAGKSELAPKPLDRKEAEQRKTEKEERAGVYKPLIIAAIESQKKLAGSAPTLKKHVRTAVGEQFFDGGAFNLMLQKMVCDGELTQNKSTYLRAGKQIDAEVYRPLIIAAIESQKKLAGSAPTLKKHVRTAVGEQFFDGGAFNLMLRKMVCDGELTQNKSTYLRAGVEAEERRAKRAAEELAKEAAKKQRIAAEKEAEKQRAAEVLAKMMAKKQRIAAEKEAKKQRPAGEELRAMQREYLAKHWGPK